MPTYSFISGKNWMLSLAELTAYFRARDINFAVEYFSREYFVLSFEQKLDAKVIADLGGTIKVGEVKTKLPTEIVKEAFLIGNKEAKEQMAQLIVSSSDVFEGMTKAPEKLLFGVSIYFTNTLFSTVSKALQRFVGSIIKDKLANDGKRANFIGYSQDRKAQLTHIEVLKKDLINNKAEILLCIGKKETWIAVTLAVHNPFEFQKRDIYKPNERKIFAIPPRLARIMVNLSLCKAGKVLLDPFCGVGTILQEALLEKALVVGMDVNSWCADAAQENLSWLVSEYRLDSADFRVLQGDINRLTEKVGVETIDCIVCEPDLGPALRDIPTDRYAEKIIGKLKPLFYRFVEQGYEVLKPRGRLVLVTPYIGTRSGQAVTMPIDETLRQVGFKRIYPFSRDMFQEGLDIGRLLGAASLVEMDERHKVGREIHILEK